MPRQPQPTRVTVVRYQLPDGSRCTKGTRGARRMATKSETYYAKLDLADGRGRRRVPLGTSDYGQAWIELRRLQRLAADRRAGIRDRTHEAADRTLAEHVEDWCQAVRHKGTSAGQVATLRAHVLRVASLAGWNKIAQIEEDGALAALGQLQADFGRGNQTRNHYVAHLKQFTRWLSRGKHRRLPEDPLSGLSKIGVEADRRHDRRAPTDEEVALLFEWLNDPAARTAKSNRPAQPRNGMSGPQRALGYKVAMAAGLRAKELRSLRRESFDLDAGEVTVQAAYDKRRRQVSLPLPAWLVEELRAWFAAGGGCWDGLPEGHPGDALRRDLGDARAAWIRAAPDKKERRRREQSGVLEYRVPGPDGPLFFDFHSLRHWYCTWAANLPGISPRTLMALCRHSTPALTLKVYSKARTQDQREAVDQMLPPGEISPGGKISPKKENPRNP